MTDEHERRASVISKLEREYSRVDTSLIHALAFDHDPLTSLDALRQTLDTLSELAQVDDVDGNFDSSGTGGFAGSSEESKTPDHSSGVDKRTLPSDLTSLDSALERLSSDDSTYTDKFDDAVDPLELLDDDQKVAALQSMFPDQKANDIKFFLKKAKGGIKDAIETLLTNVFLTDENLLLKGVDGFAAEEQFTVVKRKKKRGKENNSPPSPADLTPQRVSSPWINTSSSSAVTTRATTSQTPIKIIPSYAPLNLDDHEKEATGWTPVARKKGLAFSSPVTNSVSSSAYHLAAGTEAYSKAALAFRRGKSDPLYGGAAAYYSEEARTHYAAFKSSSAAEADAHVAKTSTATQIDLHGVNSSDGQRIALAHVRLWWNSLGETKIRFQGRTGVGEGFRIVVGAGRHSAGGKAVLGPAVSRALVGDGWKVEIGSGLVLVKGRQKG
ncbi:hypothetical protein BT63DRAFT_234563 [Microthyrium microscopicum]|uniref:Smr domain-containing protein n=1 Tax=Microthyrium microscopicum TaxID=703497 RepID=A0A6A6UHF4_9PEZI|nr:hypothetical protein BT63DRAFT_234563 [Microthyrium microscopicum]